MSTTAWKPEVAPASTYLSRARMSLKAAIHKRHQFRLMLCGHKAVETGAACLVFMVQGQLGQATLGHFLIASKIGMLMVFSASRYHSYTPCSAFCKQVDVRNICRRVRILRGCCDPRITLSGRIHRSSVYSRRSICVVRHPFLHSSG